MTAGTARSRQAADGGTKVRALAVALDLFSREGYDAVSMREIAEELGVTKAALYHHFDSKEELARALVGGYLAALEDVVTWAAREPRPTLDEVLSAWVALVRTQGLAVIRFIHANQRVVRELGLQPPKGPGLRIDPLVEAIAGADADAETRMRVRMALFAVNTAALAAEGLDTSEDEAFRIAVKVAREIVHGGA